MKKTKYLVLLFSFVLIGCSSKVKEVTVAPKNLNPYVRQVIDEYIAAKKDKTLYEVAPEHMQKANKIAKLLIKENDPQIANHYANLLKNEIKIAKLTKRKYDTIERLNQIIIKRNQAIEDAKHQNEIEDDETISNTQTMQAPVSIKEKFFYEKTPDGELYVISGKYFDSDEVIFNKDMKQFINYLANYMSEHPFKSMILISYTDSVGGDEYSKDIALRRANRIKEELVDRNIDENRIKVVAKGATNFLASNDSEEGRIKNNRIIIKIK